MNALWIMGGLALLAAAILLAVSYASKSAEQTRSQWDVNSEDYDDVPLFGPTGNVQQLSEEEVKNLRIQHGLRRLMEDIHAVQADVDQVRAEQQEDPYTKKLRLNAEHERELRKRKPLTPAQVEAQAGHSNKHYWSNRDSILQKRKDKRIADAIAAGRKPRVHATYLRQDDNPHPVGSPEYYQFSAEKRRKFHEQKHTAAALSTPLPAPAPVLTYSREPINYTYGQRALA